MNRVLFGQTTDGDTTVFGHKESQIITKIYIDGEKQLAPNEFSFTLNRFGNINHTTIGDYQEGIKKIFGIE